MSEGEERGRVLTDEERARLMREQLKSLHAFDLAYEMMVSLVTFGYQKLGLTGETAELRDLDDAHYVIELLAAILRVSDREHPVSDLRDLHATLAQMQLGYVQALELEGRRPDEPEGVQAAEETDPAPAVAEPEPADPEQAAGGAPEDAAGTVPHEATAQEVEAHLAADEAAEPAETAAVGEPAAKRPGEKTAAAKKTARKPAARKKPAPKADEQG